ncbi:MAG: ABC transporter ATP-binding protein [Alphaproteobacteria bacterium]|nr:ABC transporter ATP-binding protein [Alphaproteobacteria bacterium]
MATSDIQLSRVTKRFPGGLVAVDSLDLTVASGEVVCLLGPSGCGKTTTLRMIAGLEHETGGEIRIGGKRVNGLTPAQRNVAMVFQFYALYPSLSVAENLAYPLHADRLGKAEIAARIRRVAAVLDLGHILERRPHELAEGEKQRVAVGRSIVRTPTCFLFDEPLSRLDIQLRKTMRTQIKQILERLDKPTVIVTHDQIEALTMADRIAVMRDGRIEQAATPHDLFSRPANLFVASFIGTPQMNLVEATLVGAEGVSNGQATCRFRLLDSEIVAPAERRVAELAPASKVTVGIRPRSFELVPPDVPGALPATVDIVEPMGAEVLAHLVQGGADLRCVVPHTTRLAIGERVGLRCKPGQLHVFAADGRLVQ